MFRKTSGSKGHSVQEAKQKNYISYLRLETPNYIHYLVTEACLGQEREGNSLASTKSIVSR